MYSIPFPVSHIRTRIRQEFERHRYVNKLNVVDVLLQQSNADFQVSAPCKRKTQKFLGSGGGIMEAIQDRGVEGQA
jgi:hypothetical protein